MNDAVVSIVFARSLEAVFDVIIKMNMQLERVPPRVVASDLTGIDSNVNIIISKLVVIQENVRHWPDVRSSWCVC